MLWRPTHVLFDVHGAIGGWLLAYYSWLFRGQQLIASEHSGDTHIVGAVSSLWLSLAWWLMEAERRKDVPTCGLATIGILCWVHCFTLMVAGHRRGTITLLLLLPSAHGVGVSQSGKQGP